ncbi:MAG TPA: prepilin peptidase [Candidatus Paceibacterota bacterium]|nr:prepilin peptidase [Candidatus Paceibacterota bacterium]
MQIDFILPVTAVVLGAILGSFLNALSYRFNTGRGMGGRSSCDTCGHTLSPLDLVPVFSFVFLGGRCRYCSARISIQNPLVEIAAAILSLMVYLAHPEPLSYAFWLVVWMTYLFVVVYDLKHTIIPWSCSILLAVLTFAALFVSFDWFSIHLVRPDIWALLAGPILAAPLTLLSLVSHGRWMGWGDGALEVSLGWMLGLSMGATALMLAFWIGAAVGILLMLLKKGLTMKSELPFAPFLVLGALAVYFFHVDFFSSVAFLFQG